MREIKFRAWDNKRKKWVTDGPQDVLALQLCSGDLFRASTDSCESPVGWCDGMDISLMQFTGLQDKNGKDIYEGDVTRRGYVIMWSNKHALFCEHYFQTYGRTWLEASYPIDAERIEVIANIYENPELINA